MNKKVKYPTVVLVGRTNVGKSTLFNRLASEQKSIVFEREGVTRDYIEEKITWADKTFKIIDTGGFEFKRNMTEIETRVQEKVLRLLDNASLLLFVCDGKNGLTQGDLHIAKILHRTRKPVIVVVNKADNKRALEDNAAEFYSLSFEEIINVSSIHGTGIGRLLERITDIVPQPTTIEGEVPQYKMVIVGKPNVGKSSLMNLLLNQERSIVSEVAGTTREPITEMLQRADELIQLVDTAGVRKKSRVDDELEQLMVKSSLEAIREADVVLLMIDASQGKISDQELKLLFYVYEVNKPVLVLYNKTDLIKEDDYTKAQLKSSLEEYNFVLKKTPQINISCLSKKNVSKVIDQVNSLVKRCSQSFNSSELDELVKQSLSTKPMYHKRILLRLFKIRNVPAQIPTFVLHVNYPEFFGPSQLGFIENIIRSHYDIKGCPVQFSVRKV
ncbi:ribosome biogenesis GTPase Der [Candidatus Babeliales bacterium]|nr:ribosome biogenesis GTPase Der [Candidatus Babeliales bacterium]